ncbi:uncharacterized protein [Watersipora subatra]|uniref:uncharacterized protein n=1 Tax=Watersipora subatra TaxID=2589382 RepID=UPI00355B2983
MLEVWRFGGQHCAAGAVTENDPEQLEIDESDFTAVFDGVKWTMEWKWENGELTMANQCSEYAVPNDCREIFDDEVSQWISNGWLEKFNPDFHGKADGVIPLMAARQPNKPKKVRPVMDYRQLNTFIKSNPGIDVAVCQEKLPSWRKRDNLASILDLRKAYLQIHVSEQLQRFQLVKFKGQLYVMKRMSFGLSVAPKVMSKIIAKVLAQDSRISEGTDHYIDDIWVDESVVTAEEEIPTKYELFSVIGEFIGHYPVAGWLRLACSYLKRQTNKIGWDEEIPVPVRAFAKEVMNRISQHDPVTGRWSVSNVLEGDVWCDASSLAVGCCLETDGSIVEDATWLRKVDGSHINVAELEAVIKGLNIALRWGIAKLKIVTDSASVYGWVRSILVDSKRPKVSGLSEMVIKRRLGIISQLVIEYHIKMTIQLVPSTSNKADVLTRVPQKWLNSPCLAVVTLADKTKEITKLHGKHHLGVKKTLYLAKRMCGQDVDEKVVKQVVDSCNQCRRVDPVSIKWNHGRLSVDKVWQRVAMDIAYVNKRAFLTLIDCGPSRFAMWRRLPNETASTVAKELHRIFLE